MLRIMAVVVTGLALGCTSSYRSERLVHEATPRIRIARAALKAVLSVDGVRSHSVLPMYLSRESPVITFVDRGDGRFIPDDRSEYSQATWGSDLEFIVDGTPVRPGPPPTSISGCPANAERSARCRAESSYTRYVMSQPDVAPSGEARVAFRTTHHWRGGLRPSGHTRVLLLLRSGADWMVTRVDTTSIM